jgi:amino acid transporter
MYLLYLKSPLDLLTTLVSFRYLYIFWLNCFSLWAHVRHKENHNDERGTNFKSMHCILVMLTLLCICWNLRSCSSSTTFNSLYFQILWDTWRVQVSRVFVRYRGSVILCNTKWGLCVSKLSGSVKISCLKLCCIYLVILVFLCISL